MFIMKQKSNIKKYILQSLTSTETPGRPKTWAGGKSLGKKR